MPLLRLIKKEKKKNHKSNCLACSLEFRASGTEWIKDKDRILEFSVLIQSMSLTCCLTRQGVEPPTG